MRLRAVVLPEPDEPAMEIKSPLTISKLMPWSLDRRLSQGIILEDLFQLYHDFFCLIHGNPPPAGMDRGYSRMARDAIKLR
jgi:hypothetical protein